MTKTVQQVEAPKKVGVDLDPEAVDSPAVSSYWTELARQRASQPLGYRPTQR